MKKILLSLAAVALAAASMQATSYKLFDYANGGEWGTQGTGFAQTQKFGDVSFSIVTDKASSSTDLVSPVGNAPYAWRVYKNSTFTVSSSTVTMKAIRIEYDTYNENKYVLELGLSDGWSGSISDAVYNLVSSGSKTFTGTASAGQVRINALIVSDEETISDSPLTPSAMEPNGSTQTPDDPGQEIDGYVVFDINNAGTWDPKGTGFTQTSSASGATFTITTDQGSSSIELIAPNANNFAWRVYKGSNFTIESESVEMKTIQITYDDYESGKYCKELVLPTGWTGSLDGTLYTITGSGKTFTATAEVAQVRIKKIVVSGEGGSPVVSDVVYKNAFDSSISDWTVINDIDNGLSGWRINSGNPKCAIANAYSNGVNLESSAWLLKEFDLTGRTDCSMSVEQAYGFIFPTQQEDYATVNIREVGTEEWEQLVMANFPEKPASGNWTSFVSNEFDLSAYDDTKVEIAFHYTNDGNQSISWELKNFVLKGKVENAVNEISVDEVAPVFYTLQGVRVAEPSNGLYIMVKGNKASKILVR